MKMSIPRVVRAMAAAVLAVVVHSGTLAAQDRTGVVAGRVIEAGGAPSPMHRCRLPVPRLAV
jgi:hypothetical protein